MFILTNDLLPWAVTGMLLVAHVSMAVYFTLEERERTHK